jgi:6-phosphogluconolactonase (cycloisomerase 2 family)
MSTRFAWLLGVVTLVLIGLLLACGSSYNSSSDGLVVIGSQGSALLESFSFSLASGHATAVNNTPYDTANETCVLNGFPSSLVMNPAGTYAYVIINGNDECLVNGAPGPTGIQVFSVNSDGTLTAQGSLVMLNQASVQVCVNNNNNNNGNPITGSATVPVVPVFLSMDHSGNLFVANAQTVVPSIDIQNVEYTNVPAPGAISVLSASNGTLTEVSGSPFTVPASCTTPVNNFTALATTPTVFPGVVNGQPNAVCSDNTAPSIEFLYVADSTLAGNIWEFQVDTSTGALGNPPGHATIPNYHAGQVPSGVAVDPCDRFVYVSNQGTSNSISAFTICAGSSTTEGLNPSCPSQTVLPNGDGSLLPVTGSPFSNSANAENPGQLIVDAYGHFLYVLNGTNNISPFRISPVSGSLSPLTPATVAAGLGATSIAIRSDDSWLFVTNFSAATVSQYAVTPESGALSPVPVIETDNYPWGVAVK